jgi:hypothetical protein
MPSRAATVELLARRLFGFRVVDPFGAWAPP